MKIALTGGMGCGKSTVLNSLDIVLPHKYRLASYDQGVHIMYARNWKFRDELRHVFGTDERAEVARQVFGDQEKMERLYQMTLKPMDDYMAEVTQTPDVMMEVPMLYQIPNATRFFEVVLAVWCDKETQRLRIKARDHLTDEQIDQRLSRQLSVDEIASRADFVIDTSDGAVNIEEQIAVALRVAALRKS
jgi:dephospho-CoA kinase